MLLYLACGNPKESTVNDKTQGDKGTKKPRRMGDALLGTESEPAPLSGDNFNLPPPRLCGDADKKNSGSS